MLITVTFQDVMDAKDSDSRRTEYMEVQHMPTKVEVCGKLKSLGHDFDENSIAIEETVGDVAKLRRDGIRILNM